jgi:hypothetical protein
MCLQLEYQHARTVQRCRMWAELGMSEGLLATGHECICARLVHTCLCCRALCFAGGALVHAWLCLAVVSCTGAGMVASAVRD